MLYPSNNCGWRPERSFSSCSRWVSESGLLVCPARPRASVMLSIMGSSVESLSTSLLMSLFSVPFRSSRVNALAVFRVVFHNTLAVFPMNDMVS